MINTEIGSLGEQEDKRRCWERSTEAIVWVLPCSLGSCMLLSVTLPFPRPTDQLVITAQNVAPERLLNLDPPPQPTTPALVQNNCPSTGLVSLQPVESQTTLQCTLTVSPHLEASIRSSHTCRALHGLVLPPPPAAASEDLSLPPQAPQLNFRSVKSRSGMINS